MPILVNPARPSLRWEWRGKQYAYTVTPTDEGWFIRALWREGKPATAVGFTLLQRFALIASTGRKYATLTDFLRAFCQPINPAWFPGGKLSNEAITRAERRGDSAAANAERTRAQNRVVYSSTPISSVPKQYRELSRAILSGTWSYPVPTASNFTMSFADPGDSDDTARAKGEAFAAKRGLQLVPISEGYTRGLNWFFRDELSPPTITFGSVAVKGSVAAFALIPLILLFSIRQRRKY